LADLPQAQALLQQALADGAGRGPALRAPSCPHRPGWAAGLVFAVGCAGRSGSARQPEAVAVLTDISRLKSQQAELEALLRERELMFSLSDVGIVYLRGRAHRACQPGHGHA
jgi:hypothetical protein